MNSLNDVLENAAKVTLLLHANNILEISVKPNRIPKVRKSNVFVELRGVGVLASMCVTFIICCCDDGKSQERDVPLVPVYLRNENNAV